MAPAACIHDDLTVPALPRVLLVDDDRVTRRVLGRAVEVAGYEVLPAENAQEALAILRREPVAAIVADQYMPGLSGLQLFTIARVGWPDLPRILITGHVDQDLAIRAINRGQVIRFLTKPMDPAEVAEALRAAVRIVHTPTTR